MQGKPPWGVCDTCRLFIASNVLLATVLAFVRDRPDKIGALAVLLFVGWRMVDKLEAMLPSDPF